MKTEFISLSPVGVSALLVGGVLTGTAIMNHDLGSALIAGLAFMVARENARESFATGSYVRGWLVWRRIGPPASSEDSSNVVPFKGPAA